MADITTTGARSWSVEGARVGICTCLECGAAIVLDPDDDIDPILIHRQWHEGPADDLVGLLSKEAHGILRASSYFDRRSRIYYIVDELARLARERHGGRAL